ncbi:hypothetical protein RvY_13986 [Ramazzottius varieornatus]|uniref:F-box domain-containing protein n=1 Tax=Ramazzottius varieornatus TaxID=947166 RepID=A0A1D1VPV4_RAMVA|nr:hypothetical protein RvY_13986 [Ramazzottius varieornatus]
MEKNTRQRRPKPASQPSALSSRRIKRAADAAALDAIRKAAAKRLRLPPQPKNAVHTRSQSNVDPDSPQGPIMNLPNEILVRILKMLPMTDQRRSTRVCKRWRLNLNTPAFFQKVNLCNAASIGLQATAKYLKVGVNHETVNLTFSCTTVSPAYTLASVAIVRSLANRCPLLKRLTFTNGRLPLEALPAIPSSVQTLVLTNVTLINGRGKIFKFYRKETGLNKKAMKAVYQELHRSTTTNK